MGFFSRSSGSIWLSLRRAVRRNESSIEFVYLTNKNQKLMKSAKKSHPGFKAVQSSIARKEGVSKKAAGAILASASRKASAKAKAANPRLRRVK